MNNIPLSNLYQSIRQIEGSIVSLQKALESLKAEAARFEKENEMKREKELDDKQNALLSLAPDTKRLPKIFDISEKDLNTDSLKSSYSLDKFKSLIIKNYNPETKSQKRAFLNQLEYVFDEVREGDIIDVAGERGTGYFYVYEDKKSSKLHVAQTQGDYGYYLPKEALPILHKFKIETAEQASLIWKGDCVLGINLGVDEKDEEWMRDFKQYDENNEYLFKLNENPL